MRVNSGVPKVVGMYLSDHGTVYNNNEMPIGKCHSTINPAISKYIPIFDGIQLKMESGIKFCDLEDQRNEIEVYDRNVSSNKALSSLTVKQKKIDITANDLHLGPVEILLNFTGLRVSIVSKSGMRKTFLPLSTERFGEFKGKLVIMAIHSINSPQMIREINPTGNYLEDMINSYRKNSSYFHKPECVEIVEYVLKHWDSIKPVDQLRQSNTIKVVTALEVDANEIMTSGDKSLWLSAKETTVSFDDLLNVPGIPESVLKIGSGVTGQEGQLKNGLTCYIVDNKDQIGDRFMHVAGTTFKVNKIKNFTIPDGLYLIQLGPDGNVLQQEHTPLTQLDKSEYVFKTIEEARAGVDLRAKYKDELEDRRQALEAERLSLEAQRIELSNQALQDKARHEAQLRDVELSFKKQIQRLQEGSETKKVKREEKSYRMKNNYERQKYKRDTTLDTIKTVGSIAGLLAGGFVVYTKLIKSTK